MPFTVLVAASYNNVVGVNNRLPWKIPTDLARFKKITMDKTLVMGRKTYESLPVKLENRKIIVISRSLMDQKNVNMVQKLDKDVDVVSSIKFLETLKPDDIFICGGADIYSQCLHLASKVILTRVHTFINEDNLVYFKELSDITNNWRINKVDFPLNTTNDQYPTTYIEYTRPFRTYVEKG